MAATKTSDLSNNASPSLSDLFMMVDVSDTSMSPDGTNKKVLASAALALATGSGTVTHTGALASGKAVIGNGTDDIMVSSASGVAHLSSGTLSGSNVDLTSEVTGDLPFSNLAQASGASKLLGRGSASGAGDFQEITVGTNLTMSGTTLSATGGGGGGLVLLEQHTASTSASLDFTTSISSTYDDYVIRFINVLPATDDVSLFFRVSTDGGGTYDSTNNYYEGIHYIPNTGSVALNQHGPTNAADYAEHVSNTTASGGVSGEIALINPLSTSVRKTLRIDLTSARSASFGANKGSGVWNSTTAVDAFRFYFSSGDIASGTIRVYGVER